MPAVVRAFRSTHSSVELTVLEGTDSEVLEWLLTAAVDVATVTRPHPDLDAAPFASDRMLAVAAADHVLADQPARAVPARTPPLPPRWRSSTSPVMSWGANR